MNGKSGRKSIFRSLFVPMIAVMLIQTVIFYIAAVYGGLEKSLKNNAIEILSERLNNRANEVETIFNNKWTDLDNCVDAINNSYNACVAENGKKPFADNAQIQIDFLNENGNILIDTLRYTQTNGIFLILNDSKIFEKAFPDGGEQKYGICIRDMDQNSNFSGREDLLLERSPSSIVNSLGCLLDSWWEAKYSFETEAEGAYYYAPLKVAYNSTSRNSGSLAYLSDAHRISNSDPMVVSYSLPLFSADGYPYAVLGIELSVQYLSSLLPSSELHENDTGCYVLAFKEPDSSDYYPIVSTGTLSERYFSNGEPISAGESTSANHFAFTAKDESKLYITSSKLEIYDNNNPFEDRKLVLLAAVEENMLFSYINQIKSVLIIVSLITLTLGIISLAIVSRRFAAPITALAKRVRGMKERGDNYKLEHLGITEIDQLVDSIEELNQNVSKNSARTEFFSRMSHDMRTPMNAIISFSSQEMLENTDEDVKNDYLDKIHSSGIYLLGLINEVLDMTKIESNKTGLNLSVMPANRLFTTPVHVTEELADKKQIDFKTQINLPSSLYIMADEQHLNQVVMNLLSNAVKFTDKGGTVRFSAEIHDEPSGLSCRVIVSDTGIGMSEEYMKNLYTPFEQENSNHEGTGLGLSIAKKLVGLMNGTIECESVKYSGTVFTLNFPLTAAKDVEHISGTATDAENSSKDLSKLNGKRVLVSEDNAINITIIKLLLERVGLTIDVAENGKHCVELFEQSKPGDYSCILMDVRMPVMNGLEASAAIRALSRDDAKSIPIIAMTADAFAEDAKNCFAAGMDEHLLKPIEPEKLYNTLLKYC